MALVGTGSSDECHIQNSTLVPALFHSRKMRVAYRYDTATSIAAAT